MKDLTKLEQRIKEADNAFNKEQGKRIKSTFFVLSGVIYLFAFMTGEIGGDIKTYLSWLVVAPIFAGLTMFISMLVLLYISTGAMRRTETIAKLEGRLEEVKNSKYNTCEDTKETKNELKRLGDLLELIIDQYNDLGLYEEFKNDAEEIEVLRFQLEELESSLELIDNEYQNLKRKNFFNDEVGK